MIKFSAYPMTRMDIANISSPTPLPKIASSVLRDRVCDVCVDDGAVLVIEIVTGGHKHANIHAQL